MAVDEVAATSVRVLECAGHDVFCVRFGKVCQEGAILLVISCTIIIIKALPKRGGCNNSNLWSSLLAPHVQEVHEITNSMGPS